MGLFSRRNSAPVSVDQHLATDLAVIDTARSGDVRPLSDRLADLARQGRWHHRQLVVDRAAAPESGPAGWIEAWSGQAPDDGGATVTLAVRRVRDAWEARSGQVAAKVSAARFRSFHQLLDEATPDLEAAARRCLDDPTAWATLMDQARGLQLGVGRLHDLVSAAQEAAPDGFAWQASATEFLSPWWFGSTEESWDFAVTCATRAPGTRAVLLPAYAAVRSVWKESTPTSQAMLAEALPEAWRYLHTVSDDEVELVETTNFLAARLLAAGQKRHAANFLPLAGDRVDRAAWSLFDADPVTLFREVRAVADQSRR